uniref:hypothetical protein n=1 Tax=Escherichia coli TaxID=562 RepID=UPI001F21067E|nr:hypothetical protein [Escherichia coli]UGK56507.1 hypothetical protein [Escherichia coli]
MAPKRLQPQRKKLVLKECIEFLETIPELRCNPDLEAWKRRHSEQLALLQADNSKFAASIAQQLNNNLFLTVRQLESFYSTYQPVSKAFFQKNAGFPIEHSFNIGDVVSFDIILGIRNFWLIKCQRCKEEKSFSADYLIDPLQPTLLPIFCFHLRLSLHSDAD